MKTNTILSISFFSSLLFFTSCSSEIISEYESDGHVIEYIKVQIPEPEDDADTRSQFNLDSSDALIPVWAANDTLGIFPTKGDQVNFPLTSGSGGQSFVFDGGGWGLKDKYAYAAYFPFSKANYFRTNKTIVLDYTGQVQNGINSTAHMGAYDFLASGLSNPKNDYLNLELNRLECIVRLYLTIPKAGKYTKVSISTDEALFVTKQKLDISGSIPKTTNMEFSNNIVLGLTNFTTTSANQQVKLFIMAAPVDLTGKTLTVNLTDKDGNIYRGTLTAEKDQLLKPNVVRKFTSTLKASGDGGGDMPGIGDDDDEVTVTKYYSSTKTKAIPFVIVSEGFTKSQLSNFRSKAKEMIDFIFSVDPYKQYKNYFNVYLIDVPSNESGADILDKSIDRDTYFGAGWNEKSYSNMSADNNKVYSFVTTNCPDIASGKVTIDETAIIMLINDERYGGICHSTNLGRGYAMVPLTKNDNGGDELNWRGIGGKYGTTNIGTWKNTALHEGGGHMFGRLEDEYPTAVYYFLDDDLYGHNFTVPFGMNVSVDKVNKLYWSSFIPTTQGMIQSGKYLYVSTFETKLTTKSVFRAEEISCMDDNRAYFNAWQRWLIAKRIHDIAGESFTTSNFLSQDNQYQAIQSGVANRGTEGQATTTYNGLTPIYPNSNAIMSSNYVENIYPPLAPPVLTIIEKGN